MSLPEPIEEQILAGVVTRLEQLAAYVPEPYYAPRFITRTYRKLDEVHELPGYLVLWAPEQSGADVQTLGDPSASVLASVGVEVLAYGAGSDQVPTDRVLTRLLAQAERALLQPTALGGDPDPWVDIQNTRQIGDFETEVGAPWRSLRSHLYRVRYFYTRGEP